MIIWCKHGDRQELQKFYKSCVAHLPVKRDIETKLPKPYFGHAWLTSSVWNSELIPQGNTIHRMNRPGDKIGGGVLIAVQNSLSSSTCETLVTDEILAVSVTPNQNCNITFICIYKPPIANNSLFNTNLQAVLISTRKNNSRICLLGDFNFPHIRRKTDGMGEPKSYDDTIFCETLENFSFQQMNILPSTRHGNVLDLILTNFTEHFQIQTVYDDEFKTDHIIFNFNLPVPSKPKRLFTTRCIYNYKNVNWSDMEMKINTSNLEDRVIEATNIDESLSIWMNTLRQSIEEYVSKVKVNNSKSVTLVSCWIPSKLLLSKRSSVCDSCENFGRRESYRQTKKSHDGVDETVVDQKKTCMKSDIFTIYWQNSIWKTPKAIQISWWLPTDDTWLVQTDGWKSDNLFAETDPIYVRVTWCWIWTGYDISLRSQWEYIYACNYAVQ